MPLKQKIAVVFLILVFLVFVFNLVRTRRLREAYSAFWLIAGGGMLVLVIRYDWLVAITRSVGIVVPASAVLLFGLLFILAVEVQVASSMTKKHQDIQKLVQELGLLTNEVQSLKQRLDKLSEFIVEK